MYLLRVETHNGAKRTLIADEDEALKRMKLWRRHPTFIKATVQAVAPIRATLASIGGKRYENARYGA